ncbi:CST complex subunit STN1 isoform X3 [Perognathus longimembris pacificus]|uniref:CST complex subunit STN1 isoform X3 n=1 Tax=Perognathus longimembris pacificus TaxID=214514 RepID=UPI002018F45C|nr:CST complex subunit STN1 isoform X3 [Perognathus longimembris pacificus]
MQSESSPCEEETPSFLWGLDPVFLAFAKLYIRDILGMKKSRQVPGIFFYNNHPIRQVDIVGVVVGVRERDAFYSYGVDDSTGVINCICWKKLSNSESSAVAPTAATAPSTPRELSVTSQLKKLQETIEQSTKIELGDIIRIRGYIRTYREEREIHATIYYKLDDPMWNIQIARMLELPTLYRKVYDQPFRNPALEKEEALSNSNLGSLDLASLTCLLSEKVKEFLMDKRVQTFYQQELETVESLLALANQPVIRAHSDQVTRENKDLHKKILHIIQEEYQKPNHVEKGCHFLHILACARLSLHPDLSKAVLQQVLELLEAKSDIVSTMDQYYIAF